MRPLALAASVWFLAAGFAAAADLRNVLTGYTVASWTAKDGLPSSVVRTIAQDSQGYLWVGTDAGLLRFDGIKFVDWDTLYPATPLPHVPIRALHVSRDGSLWIGFADPGAIVRVRLDGNVDILNTGSDNRTGGITAFREESNGSILVGASGGLYSVVGDRIVKITPGDGLPDERVSAVYIDRHFNTYVCTTIGVFLRPRDQRTFTKVNPLGDVLGLTEDRSGRIWITDRTFGFALLGGNRTPWTQSEKGRGVRLMFDSQGFLWVATNGQGGWRVRVKDGAGEPSVERVTAMTGLVSDSLSSVLEDRDGNIWVGSAEGLNRLTAHKVTALTHLGLVGGVQATADGDIWVATTSDVIRYRSGDPTSKATRQNFGDARITTIHGDNNDVWVATSRGLFRVSSRPSTVLPARGQTTPSEMALTSDSHGAIWSHDRNHGLCRWVRGECESIADVPRASVNAIFADREDRIWILYADRRVGVLGADRTFRSFGVSDGLDAGVYGVAYQDRAGNIWLGGSDGLSRFSRNRFASVRRADGFRWWVRAIVEDDSGRLWLGTDLGIVYVAPQEIERAFSLKGYGIPHGMYNVSDGVGGVSVVGVGNKGSARAAGGRLWFVTALGVTVIDPRFTISSSKPFPVIVEDITADHRIFQARSGIALPARTSYVLINYTVLNLTSPLRTHYRYWLEGFDKAWVDAGTRRQAVYTNLPPRAYKLRVVSDSSDGTWMEPGTVMEFSIRPAFYQTWWFASLCVVCVIGAITGIWRLHVKQVRNKYEATLQERLRISREIHDTLLQSLVGLSLRCEAMAGDLTETAPHLGRQLVSMRRDLEEYIREGRESIWNLRSSKPHTGDLAKWLRAVSERAAAGRAHIVDATLAGPQRQCPAQVHEQLGRISQEAVANAVRHGHADEIQFELRYESKFVTLTVSDNGCGFDTESLNFELSGHYGFATMRERAESLGGVLRVTSRIGHGTQVEARVPLSFERARTAEWRESRENSGIV